MAERSRDCTAFSGDHPQIPHIVSPFALQAIEQCRREITAGSGQIEAGRLSFVRCRSLLRRWAERARVAGRGLAASRGAAPDGRNSRAGYERDAAQTAAPSGSHDYACAGSPAWPKLSFINRIDPRTHRSRTESAFTGLRPCGLYIGLDFVTRM